MRQVILITFLVSALASQASAQSAGDEWPFPMRRAVDRGDGALVLDRQLAREMRGSQEIVLREVALPDGRSVDLALRQVDARARGGVRCLSGVPIGDARHAVDQSFWSGRVEGDPHSSVFLAFSSYGSRGWIRSEGRVVHLIARPGERGDWSNTVSSLVADESIDRSGDSWQCGGISESPIARSIVDEAIRSGRVQERTRDHSSGHEIYKATSLPPTSYPLLECRVVIETDDQLVENFGTDVAAYNAAFTYMEQLMASASADFVEEINVILTWSYLNIQDPTDLAADPWQTPDPGVYTQTTSGAWNLEIARYLLEFQDTWSAGRAPESDLCFMVSGEQLGGGISYLSNLCHPDRKFVFLSNVATDSLLRDSILVMHEFGHSFGAMHAFQYQNPQLNFGTSTCDPALNPPGFIVGYMSYCFNHVAPTPNWGVFTLDFNPEIADIMRYFVDEMTSLKPYEAPSQGGGMNPNPLLPGETPAYLSMSYEYDGPPSAGKVVFDCNNPFDAGATPAQQITVFAIANLTGATLSYTGCSTRSDR